MKTVQNFRIAAIALNCAVALSFAFALGACCPCSCSTSVTVDPAKALIVAPKAAKAAADELQLHLKLITGVDVPVLEKASAGAYAFAILPSKIGGNPEACEWEVTEQGATFRGNAYFAVLDFLENALGVRWPEEDFIAYDAQNPLVVTKLSGAWVPELKIRTIRMAKSRNSKNAEALAKFARRMREGRHDAPVYGHAFTKHWMFYGKDHPEYFAMRKDGLRGPKNVKAEELMGNIAVYAANVATTLGVCVTSTGLVEQIVADWKKAGAKEYINLCENDIPGQDSCHCPACRALDVVPEKVDPKWETHYADRYVWFGNQVLAAARKVRPDVKVCYYAYNATQDAPKREVPDPAAVAGIVPTYFSDSYVSNYVGSWKRVGLAHFFYRPNRHYYYDCPYLPMGSEEHFLRIFQYLYSQGAIGFDYDAPSARHGSFDWLDRYVLDHAMQDPSKPFSHWEDHYCSAYGAAAADVKAYFRYWREEVWNKRLEPYMDDIARRGKWFNFGRGVLQHLGEYYKASDFDAAERHIAAAEARELSPSGRKLVEMLRVRHDHARVFFEAVAHKSKANTEKLIAYRRAHGYPLYTWQEQYYGDITGVEGLLGPEKKDTKK